MAENLKELVRKAIMGSCHFECALPFNFSDTKPLFIKIKNGQVSMSKEMDSLDNADSCMIFYIRFSDNTVPDKFKRGNFVTFRNQINSFIYVDSEGNKSYSFKDGKFEISGIWQCGYYLQLKFHNKELMSVKVTEENINHLWNCYLTAKKCLQIQREELESAKSELKANIETLSNDYESLKQRYDIIVDSIDKIAQLTKTEGR